MNNYYIPFTKIIVYSAHTLLFPCLACPCFAGARRAASFSRSERSFASLVPSVKGTRQEGAWGTASERSKASLVPLQNGVLHVLPASCPFGATGQVNATRRNNRTYMAMIQGTGKARGTNEACSALLFGRSPHSSCGADLVSAKRAKLVLPVPRFATNEKLECKSKAIWWLHGMRSKSDAIITMPMPCPFGARGHGRRQHWQSPASVNEARGQSLLCVPCPFLPRRDTARKGNCLAFAKQRHEPRAGYPSGKTSALPLRGRGTSQGQVALRARPVPLSCRARWLLGNYIVATSSNTKRKPKEEYTWSLRDQAPVPYTFRTFSLASGEIHKENFTDILNTTFEQVAFSLGAKDKIDTIGAKPSFARDLKGLNLHLDTSKGKGPCFGQNKANVQGKHKRLVLPGRQPALGSCLYCARARHGKKGHGMQSKLCPLACRAKRHERSLLGSVVWGYAPPPPAPRFESQADHAPSCRAPWGQEEARQQGKKRRVPLLCPSGNSAGQSFARAFASRPHAVPIRAKLCSARAFCEKGNRARAQKPGARQRVPSLLGMHQRCKCLARALSERSKASFRASLSLPDTWSVFGGAAFARRAHARAAPPNTEYVPFVKKKKTLPLRVRVGDYIARGDKIYKSIGTYGQGTGTWWLLGGVATKHKGACRCKAQKASFKPLPCPYLVDKTKFAQDESLPCMRCRAPSGQEGARNWKCLFAGHKHLKPKSFVRRLPVTEDAIPIISGTTGKIIRISRTQITFQKVQSVLFYSNANLHVRHNDWVKRGSPILTLTHQTLITGDIVQGIPRIEQLFEAFTSPPPGTKNSNNLHNTLHTQVRDIFRKAWLKNVLPIAVRQSLEEIQQILVESIQKVYLSQGVLIADKHVEIIVRQMTSKVEILDSGSTGLLLEEVLNVRQIENANLTTPGKKALYVPAILGLTQAALSSDSFISAASFQETTRVLSRDAIIGKSDFLRGLKEKVVIGDLISAGTGLEIYFTYNFLPNKLNSIILEQDT